MAEYLGIKEIASEVRETLKNKFQNCKFSVTIQRYSGGQSLYVDLMEAPFEVFASIETLKTDLDKERNQYAIQKGYAQLNHYQLIRPGREDDRNSNGTILTEKAWNLLKRVSEISLKNHWDDSDPQTDYFNCNFYFHLNIGKWNKPFKKTGKVYNGTEGQDRKSYSDTQDRQNYRVDKILDQILN